MARPPVAGQWRRLNRISYTGAAKWGTGIDPIHAEYGSDPLRIHGRYGDHPEVTPPFAASPDFVQLGEPWGYNPEDIAGTDVYAIPSETIPFKRDDWPRLGDSVEQVRAKVNPDQYHPWNINGYFKNLLRGRRGGALDGDFRISNQIPIETVSEGWVNKPKDGAVADSEPSDPSQYEMQTSMRQRYETRVNAAAVTRATDDPRSSIGSRVTGQKVKHYSGQERHYDMFPYQQDQLTRPFYYRTAGTGPAYYLEPNAMYVSEPMQRTPPADPSLGPQEIALSGTDYGYTTEDGFYA